MAKEKKQFKFTIQNPNTPRLTILKQPDGEYTITYAQEDPLNLRTEKTANLDAEVSRLFGYSNWQEYKKDNLTDLTKERKRDKEGNITQAPTVHPFHVAYALEEFVESINISQYEIVGVPTKTIQLPAEKPKVAVAPAADDDVYIGPGMMLEEKQSKSLTVDNIESAEGMVNMRRLFFGDSESDSAGSRAGVINIAMFRPEEGLTNKNVIARAKQKWGSFKDIIFEKLKGQLPVLHPSGKYWKAGATSYKDITDDIKEALVIDVKTSIANTPMLKENAQLTEINPRLEHSVLPDVVNEYADEIILGLQIVDPTGLTSWPDMIAAGFKLGEEPDIPNLLGFGFSVLAVVPLIGLVTKPTKAAKLALASADKLSKGVKAARAAARTPADRVALGELQRLASKAASDVDIIKNGARWADELDTAAKTIARSNPQLAASLSAKAAKARRDFAKARKLGLTSKITKARVAANLAGEVGKEVIGKPEAKYYPDWYKKYVLGDDTPQQPQALPDFPVSIDSLTFYILPKDWRSLGDNWLSKQEKVLAQRVGANNNFGVQSKGAAEINWAALGNLIDFGTVSPGDAGDAGEQASQEGEKTESYVDSHFLVFGHSQAGKFSKSLVTAVEMKGGKVTKKIHSGHSDGSTKNKKGLDDFIKEVPRKNYTHALLFLGGNVGVSGPNYEKEKTNIINFTISKLKIPKENILVVLPPVNRADPDSYTLEDAKKLVQRKKDESSREYETRLQRRLRQIRKGAIYSAKRGDKINKEARRHFELLRVKVHPPIVGRNKEDFLDGYHVNSNGTLAGASANTMLGSFSFIKTNDATNIPSTKPPKEEVARIVVEEAIRAGVDPLVAVTIARIESGLNPLSNADKKGPYKGLFQFGRQYRNEWAKYGLDWEKVHDARHSAAAFMKVIKKKIYEFRRAGMIKSSASNINRSEAYLIYLSWQQGSYGTKTIYKAAYRGGSIPNKIQRNMDANTYPKTKNIDPEDFLKMWRGKMLRFMSRTEKQYAGVLRDMSISESKDLGALFKIIEEINNNELVQKKI